MARLNYVCLQHYIVNKNTAHTIFKPLTYSFMSKIRAVLKVVQKCGGVPLLKIFAKLCMVIEAWVLKLWGRCKYKKCLVFACASIGAHYIRARDKKLSDSKWLMFVDHFIFWIVLVTQKADDITQVEDRSKMKIQHLRARVHFIQLLQKWHFSHFWSMQ